MIRPNPLDVITSGRVRIAGTPAEAMLRDFLQMNPVDRAEFLFWTIQDLAAEQQRMAQQVRNMMRMVNDAKS